MYSSHQQNPVVNNYLTEFRKQLRFLAKKDKENILKEIESHLYEKAESLGGFTEENFMRATREFGTPKDLAKNYKELYSYSTIFIIVLMILGFFISFLTVPFSVPGFNRDLIAVNNLCLGISTIFTILIFIYIFYIGKNFGKWPGLFVGFACVFGRVIMLSALVGLMGEQTGEILVTADGGLCFGFGLVSLFMPLVGYLAGRTTFKFKDGFALENKV